ncbi:AAA family ATPase [Nocardia sp. NPDC051030]|uniref:AAA family ATPase n=1 Tax=Nocardia sp. NPDC051030 TaxID=3155162 RepID=UPI003427AC9F
MNAPYVRRAVLDRPGVPSFDDYPFSLPVVRELSELELHPRVTFLVGENGSGKSTLLEAIATTWGFNPEGGTKNFNFSTRSSHSVLNEHLRLVKSIHKPRDGFFLRAESFFNVATNIEDMDSDSILGAPVIGSYGGVSLHEQSHGESFFALLMHRFGGHGFYVLDEPEAALSPSRQLAMIARMHELVRARSQFLIATHSPILMSYPDSWIYQIGETGVERVEYEDTDHYRITRTFLDNPAKYLDELLD